MTAPRQPRHRLADDSDVPAPAAPVEPPTQMLPIVPRQRAAVPQVFPTRSSVADDRDRAVRAGAGPAAPSPVRSPEPAPARRGLLPVVLAGVTALVLALGVAVVVVESGGPAGATPISGR